MFCALHKHTTMEWQEWIWWTKIRETLKPQQQRKKRRWRKVRSRTHAHITGMLEILTNFFHLVFSQRERILRVFDVRNFLVLGALAFEHSWGGWENWYHCRFRISRFTLSFFFVARIFYWGNRVDASSRWITIPWWGEYLWERDMQASDAWFNANAHTHIRDVTYANCISFCMPWDQKKERTRRWCRKWKIGPLRMNLSLDLYVIMSCD